MKTLLCAPAILVLTLGVATSALAQSHDDLLPSRHVPIDATQLVPPPDLLAIIIADRDDELSRWVDDFSEWKTWVETWGNRRERGWLTSSRDRRQKPTPPDWLADHCDLAPDDTDLIERGCALLSEWAEYSAAQARQASVAAVQQKENPRNTVWWEHLHMDVLWPSLQWQASTYGVIGMHATTTVKGRLEAFIAPGAMLLNVPTLNGSRAWKVATNYGIGFVLFDFPFPGDRQARLHLNLAKSWLISDISDVVASRSMDFVGFSMTFKKRR